jgi:hypothetical protein
MVECLQSRCIETIITNPASFALRGIFFAQAPLLQAICKTVGKTHYFLFLPKVYN